MFKKLEKEKIIIFAIVGILAILTIIKVIDKSYEKKENIIQPITEIIETEEKPVEIADEMIIIYITGEVKNQGVIELKRRKQNSRCNRKSKWTNRKCKHKKCEPSI